MSRLDEIVEKMDLLLTMELPKRTVTDDPGRPYTVESFPVSYKTYVEQGVTNRMNDLRKQWGLLKNELRSSNQG